jgi:hypothetical protein
MSAEAKTKTMSAKTKTMSFKIKTIYRNQNKSVLGLRGMRGNDVPLVQT